MCYCKNVETLNEKWKENIIIIYKYLIKYFFSSGLIVTCDFFIARNELCEIQSKY